MESIERIQCQAALIITGAWKDSNRNKLYDELGWESLAVGGHVVFPKFLKFIMG